MSNKIEEDRIIGQRLVMTLAVISTMIVVISLNGLVTVERTHIDAPCDIIQSDDYAMPNNVDSKGYDVIRTPDAETDEEIITYECYYIKSTTLIERLFHNW